MYTVISFVNSLSALAWSLTVLVASSVIFVAECYAVHTLVTVTRDENESIIKLPWRRFIETNDK